MLASMLMESAFGAPDVSPEVLSRYNHEDGAALIAMESAADLHDIFVEGFIGMEELEFQQYRANMEGASEDVMEGIGDKIVSSAKNAIAKVKAFIKKLWEKVKGFFHSVRRYLDGIFMNGADFAKKYEGELKKLKLNGFTYTMYEYNIDTYTKKMVTAGKKSTDDILKGWADVEKIMPAAVKNDEVADENKDLVEGIGDSIKATFGISDLDDTTKVREAAWSKIRNGATSDADKKEISVKINEVITVLKKYPEQQKFFADMAKDMDRMYSGTIKYLDAYAKEADEQKAKKKAAAARKLSSQMSKYQSVTNIVSNEIKSAMAERVKTYKSVCMAAFKYKAK